MSYMWSFYSFDYDKFESVLAHSRRKVVDAVIDEMRQLKFDPKEVERHARIGEQLIETGFSYDGRPARDLNIIDRFVCDLFYTFAGEINSEPESTEFLSPGVTCDFPPLLQKRFWWSRPKPIPAEKREYHYLPFFTHCGRRLGQQNPSHCEYIAFNPEETRQLKEEVEKFLASPGGHDLNADNFNNISNDLLGPVSSAVGKEKSLLAKLS